jgi:hypothetical protein
MLEVGKRYESPRTGTWVKIAERSGGNLTFERGFAPEIRRASPPVAIQKLSLPLLAAIGPLRGYEPAYDWAEKARPMKASERRKRRRALVSWRIVNPVARSLAGIAPWRVVPLDETILRRFSHYARLGERTMGIEPRLLKIELDPS